MRASARFLRGSLLAAALGLAATQPASALPPVETVRFANDSIRFAGSLELPDGPGPHAAIVLLGGSDPAPRDAAFFRELRRLFAMNGIAALSFDKRGVGESGGRYRETPDFEQAADDGLAALRYLATRPEVDSTRVGVWGVSQGGWIALLMAARSSDVAFAINVSGPGVSPFEQTMYQRGIDLAERGVPPAQVEEALRIRRVLLRHFATGAHADSARAAWTRARGRPWLRAAQETDRWFEALAGLDAPPPPSALPPDIVAELRRTIEYDPAAVAARVRVPVLNVFGAKDRHIPVEASVAALRTAFRKGGHRDAQIRVFPNAGHGLQVVEGEAECLRCMAEAAREGTLIVEPAPGYHELLTGWVTERFGPPEARSRTG